MSDAVVRTSRDSIAKGSESFALAARLFGAQARDDASMLYAWCRHCDDVIDGQAYGFGQDPAFREGQRARLDALRAQTLAALDGRGSVPPVFEGLARVAARHGLPRRHPLALLDGFEMDVEQREHRTLADTVDYAYHVAGVVGVMMAHVMGVRDAPTLDRASDLGIALQLTNIARDVLDDARAGRIYLPRTWLAEAGVPEDAIADPRHREAVYRAALRLLDAAEPYYDSSLVGFGYLPLRGAWATAAARATYREIGVRLRRLGPRVWNGRIKVPRSRKVALALLGGAQAALARLSYADPPRPAGLYARP